MDILSGADYKIQQEVESIFKPKSGDNNTPAEKDYVHLLEEQQAEKRQEALNFLKEKFPDAEIILDTDDRTKGKEGRTFAESRYNLERPNVPNFIINDGDEVFSVFGVDPENGAPTKIRRVVGTAKNPEAKRYLLEESLLKEFEAFLQPTNSNKRFDREEALKILDIKNMKEIEDSYRDRAGKPYKAADKYGKDNFIFFNPKTKRQTVYNIPSSILPSIEIKTNLSPKDLVTSTGFLYKDFDSNKLSPPTVVAKAPDTPNFRQNVIDDFYSLFPEGEELAGGLFLDLMGGKVLKAAKLLSKPAKIGVAATASAAGSALTSKIADDLTRKYLDSDVKNKLSEMEARERIGNALLDFTLQVGLGPAMRFAKFVSTQPVKVVGKAFVDTSDKALAKSRLVMQAAENLKVRLPNIGHIGSKKGWDDFRMWLTELPPGSPFRRSMTKYARDLEGTMEKVIRTYQKPVDQKELVNTWSRIMGFGDDATAEEIAIATKLAKDKGQPMLFAGLDELGSWLRRVTKSNNQKWQQRTSNDYNRILKEFDEIPEMRLTELPNITRVKKELEEASRKSNQGEYDNALTFIDSVLKGLENNPTGYDLRTLRHINTTKSEDISRLIHQLSAGQKSITKTEAQQVRLALEALQEDTSDLISREIKSPKHKFKEDQKRKLARELKLLDKRYSEELDKYIHGINKTILGTEYDSQAAKLINGMIQGGGNVKEIKNLFAQLNDEQAEFLRKSIVFNMSRKRALPLDTEIKMVASDSGDLYPVGVDESIPGYNKTRPTEEVQSTAVAFTENYKNLPKELKTLIFGKKADKSSRRYTMDQFVGLVTANPDWLRKVATLGPVLNAGYMTAALSAGGSLLTGNPAYAIAGAAAYTGANLLSRLMTNNSFMRVITGIAKESAKTGGETSTKALERNLGKILALGQRDPELYEDIQNYFSSIGVVAQANASDQVQKYKDSQVDLPEPSPLYLPTKTPVEKKPTTSAAALPTAPAPLTGTVDPTRFSQLFPDSGSIVTSEDLLRRQA